MDAKIAALPDVVRTVLRKKNNEWRDEWLGKVKPDFVAVHVISLLSDIDVSADIIPGWDLDLGSIDDISITLFLIFERIVASSDHVIFFAAADYDGAVAAAESLGVMPDVEEVLLDRLAPVIQEYMPLIHRYFAEVLVRLAPLLFEHPAIFIEASASDDAVLVRWTYDPAGWPNLGEVVGRPENPGELPPFTVADRGPRGAVPENFLGDPTAVERLDRIDTIVVVMMENRSFDHMLGYLRTDRGEQYRGFPDNASNSFEEHGSQHPVRMRPITDLLRDNDLLQIPIDPFHSTDHVAIQIAGGAMSGFAQDVLPRGEPQTPLTYYTREHIPNYYTLADQYLVCDQWFSAHLGGTYPNRWATLGGTMPALKNIHVDDPRIGFIRDATIFDLLTEEGIDWHYYENNVSMIRMYGRYRLDNKNVLPYADATEGFEAKAKANALPPVVFVEPRITGVPPLAQASDDHPPANLAVGQEFIASVYNALASSPARSGSPTSSARLTRSCRGARSTM